MNRKLQRTAQNCLQGVFLIALCALPAAADTWNLLQAGVFPIDTSTGEVGTAVVDDEFNLVVNPTAFAQQQGAGIGLYGELGSARIGNGTFGLLASASGDDNGSAGVYSAVNLNDTLTSNGFAIVIPITVDGVVDDLQNSIFSNDGLRFNIGCTYTSNPQAPGVPCFGSFQKNFTTSGPFQQTFDLTIPTFPGQQVFWAFSAGINAGVLTDQPPFIISQQAPTAIETADFSHTGVFGPAEVLDQNGHVMSNGEITSALGIDYMNPGGGSPSSVPEPSMLGTVAASLALLALWRIRIQSK